MRHRRGRFGYYSGVARSLTPHTDPADVAAFAAARVACRRYAGELSFALAFLPRAKRDAACAVGAFCGMVRDAMGAGEESLQGAHGLRHHPLAGQGCTTCGPTDSAGGRLALLRDRLDEIYDGRLELPLPEARSEAQHALHAFAVTVRRYQIPRGLFLDLAQGVRTELSVARYATWASLERHCHAVSGTVALILAGVLGVTHSGVPEHAAKLGAALRLTAILRDLKQDRDRGRLYLPLEDLARFRYSERDLAAGAVNDAFRQLVRFQIARARSLYREAAEGLCWLADDRSRFAVSSVMALGLGVLLAIERHGHDLFARPPQLTKRQKLRQLPLAWRLSRQGLRHAVPVTTG